jgi:glycosyltransferase involved in cell wall biosynthesis
VQQADVLHLHWVNFGFLSLRSLERLFALNKPIVWTLHDMWAFTGGCHYSGDCTHYQTHCHHCPFLRTASARDLSYRVFEEKLRIFAQIEDAAIGGIENPAMAGTPRIHFVTCSQWLSKCLKSSALLGNFPVTPIPNPIDATVYKPLNQADIRRKLGLPAEKKLLLFGAMNTQDTRKGFAYLAQALTQLAQNEDNRDLELVIFGKANAEALAALPFRTHDYGSVSGDAALVDLYNACDALVLPSLEDNLPNTVMEALACGVPAVAFDTGGLPEMIDHARNGYLARYRSAEDLAAGIRFVLNEANRAELQQNARQSVLERFSEATVAARYQNVYRFAFNV